MSDNQGILYEKKINKILSEAKVQKAGFVPAGSDSNAPDALLTLGKKDYKVEVKLDLKVDFGQGSLDYDLAKNKWKLGGANTESAEQMREFLESIGVPKIVNKKWGPAGAPRKFSVPLKQFQPKDVKHDYANFTDEFVSVPSKAVADYYASKETYYIQIGGYGLYYMGSDPANLSVPEFAPTLRLRIRLKRGGSTPIYNYRFTTALQATQLQKSQYTLEDTDFLKAIKARAAK
jgi:hypothetical protein